MPTVGEASGKIVLLRRYPIPDQNSAGPHGIDATKGWPGDESNGEAQAVPDNGKLHVEDHYDNFDDGGFLSPSQDANRADDKWNDVESSMEHARTGGSGDPDPGAWHLTFIKHQALSAELNRLSHPVAHCFCW